RSRSKGSSRSNRRRRRSAPVDPDADAACTGPEVERRGHVGLAAGYAGDRLGERAPVEAVAQERATASRAADVPGDGRAHPRRLSENANPERAMARGRRAGLQRRLRRDGGQPGRTGWRNGTVLSEQAPAAPRGEGRRTYKRGGGRARDHDEPEEQPVKEAARRSHAGIIAREAPEQPGGAGSGRQNGSYDRGL